MRGEAKIPSIIPLRKIEEFTKEFRFLSNFWIAPVELEGKIYMSVEHAYQAAKTTNPAEREMIRRASEPAMARTYGRKSVKLRPDWEKVKMTVMEDLLRQKFAHPDLRACLLATGDVKLIEGNWWGDTFWGVCKGLGQNHLGKLLMKIRQELQDAKVNEGYQAMEAAKKYGL